LLLDPLGETIDFEVTGMRNLVLFALALLMAASGCSSDVASDHLGVTRGAVTATDGLCRQVVLGAAREYSPTNATDGEQLLHAAMRFTIPSVVPVVEGNAGNKVLTLTFDQHGANGTTCRYRGGASKAHPAQPDDVQAGLQYVLDACDGALTAGTVASANHFVLHVQGGDSALPRTSVALTLDEQVPCLMGPSNEHEGATAPPVTVSWSQSLPTGEIPSSTILQASVTNTTDATLDVVVSALASGLDGRSSARRVASLELAPNSTTLVAVAAADLPVQSAGSESFVELTAVQRAS
jgi:hypothetical protein